MFDRSLIIDRQFTEKVKTLRLPKVKKKNKSRQNKFGSKGSY